ncbi:MAG: hypothetical protein A2Y10_17915 [Planctomycetes bacterium GWF2_41_51]|nr:MAG: hypothetical protein A2Y10_17915 [Planctomycetes bacterium GWF2_41_51]HBG25871.1 hypothetical protein [Phycisphaerales bacterium]
MARQEKCKEVLELLKQFEDSLNKQKTKLDEEIQLREKLVKDADTGNLPDQYKTQCNEALWFMKIMLTDNSNYL